MSLDKREDAFFEEGYPFGRGFASSLRLNLQHHLFRELVGHYVHPSISKRLPARPKIADIGAGTAQWLIDLSKELPNAELDGFDISRAQYPCEKWLPANITLLDLDITKPIPEKLQDKYDLVHIQLFLCVLWTTDPSVVLRESYRMLSACPYLQTHYFFI